MATVPGLKQTAKQVLRKTGLIHPLRSLSHAMSPSRRLHYKKQLEFHRPLIQPGQLCFDVGANFGYKSSIFSELGAKVISVEPTPACIEGLKWRFGSNPSVTIVPKAVSDSVGTATFFVGENTQMASLRADWFTDWDNSKAGIEVPTTTMDELISQYGCPDFCKVDVEGCEIQVFRGLSRQIPFITFEYTRDELELTRACLTELSKLGHFACNASPMEEMRFHFSEWCDPEPLIDRLKADQENWKGDVFVRFT